MTAKPEVLFVGGGPEWWIARFERDFRLHILPSNDPALLAPDVAQRVRAVIAAASITAALIEALPRLGLIALAGAGYERIALAAARSRGIVVTNAPDVTDGCVADMAFALLLAVARHVVRGDRFIREGRWPRGAYPLVPRLHGRRLGILGLGRIGIAIARRAQGFDMPIIYHNRQPRNDVPYEYAPTAVELARRCDLLIIACPGGESTRHLVDADVLSALGASGIVVNIARGSVIDEAALITALRDRVIAGAGLDVFDDEPQVPQALRELDSVVLTPHRAGGTTETWEDCCDVAKANVRAFFEGAPPPNPVP